MFDDCFKCKPLNSNTPDLRLSQPYFKPLLYKMGQDLLFVLTLDLGCVNRCARLDAEPM